MDKQQIDKLVAFDNEGYTILLHGEHIYIEEDEYGRVVYYTEPWDKDLLSELDAGLVGVLKPIDGWYL